MTMINTTNKITINYWNRILECIRYNTVSKTNYSIIYLEYKMNIKSSFYTVIAIFTFYVICMMLIVIFQLKDVNAIFILLIALSSVLIYILYKLIQQLRNNLWCDNNLWHTSDDVLLTYVNFYKTSVATVFYNNT